MIENDIIRKIKKISSNNEHRFQFIAQYVNENIKLIPDLTVNQLAKVTFSSPATLHRFINELDVKGYKEFIYVLRYFNRTYVSDDKLPEHKNYKTLINEHYKNIATSLRNTKDLLLSQQAILKKIVDAIKAAHFVHLFAVGGTFNAAQDFGSKLKRINFNVTINNDYHNAYTVAKRSSAKDLAIFISYSGETEDLIKLAQVCRDNNTKVLLICKESNNSLSKFANYKIEVSSNESIKRTISSSSRLVLLFALDIIYYSFINSSLNKYEKILHQTMLEKF